LTRKWVKFARQFLAQSLQASRKKDTDTMTKEFLLHKDKEEK
jgi:hypothetical protein